MRTATGCELLAQRMVIVLSCRPKSIHMPYKSIYYCRLQADLWLLLSEIHPACFLNLKGRLIDMNDVSLVRPVVGPSVSLNPTFEASRPHKYLGISTMSSKYRHQTINT